MQNRVHIFGGSPRLLEHRHILRRMAFCLTGDLDVSAEEGMAGVLDHALGGDDALVASHYGFLIRHSSDPREHAEKVVMTCDLLRQARRTAH